jgi:hypothetical protein
MRSQLNLFVNQRRREQLDVACLAETKRTKREVTPQELLWVAFQALLDSRPYLHAKKGGK